MYSQQPTQFEKCPKHPTNDIVLFCLCLECKEPLCKDCCKLHVHWHNAQGTQADLDTVDSVRQQLLNEVHNLKVRFEEERAILHHFSDGEHSDQLKQIQNKLQKVKQTLLSAVNEYCHQLEEALKSKVLAHRQSHPGEKKELHHKLNSIISNLDQQEKMLLQPKYIRGCLLVMSEEQNHDFDQLTLEVDNALKSYLANAFDVFVYEEKLSKIVASFHEYVDIHEANLREELDIYTRKIREGRRYTTEPLTRQQSAPRQLPQPVPTKQMQSIYDVKGFGTSQLKQESRINNEKISKFYH